MNPLGSSSGRGGDSVPSRTASRLCPASGIRVADSDVLCARATMRRTYPIESCTGLGRLVELLRRRPRAARLALHIAGA